MGRDSGSLNISLREDRRLKDTQNLKCEDRRLQNCLLLQTEDRQLRQMIDLNSACEDPSHKCD